MTRRGGKSFLPLVLLTIIFWLLLTAVVAWVDPVVLKNYPWEKSYFGFFGIFFLAWFFLFTLVFKKTFRGFLYSLGLTIFLGLRLIRLGNIINGVLLLGLVAVIDFYFVKR